MNWLDLLIVFTFLVGIIYLIPSVLITLEYHRTRYITPDPPSKEDQLNDFTDKADAFIKNQFFDTKPYVGAEVRNRVIEKLKERHGK